MAAGRSFELKTLIALGLLCSATLIAFGAETCDTLQSCQEAVKANPNSSAAHYALAEFFFQQKNWQSAANEYRASLARDQAPQWTVVWAHVQLGKIFDAVGQRPRALNEYRQALRIDDNTRGAQDEAAKYLKSPYTR
jgi:tetratricopeptide (TPR) repeat protein